MQCFRCGKDLPIYDGRCIACGAELQLGEDFCRQCGTAILCDDCRGVGTGLEVQGAASPTFLDAPPSDDLHYEYASMQVRIPVQDSDESYQRYCQRVHQKLVEQTMRATLDGWQTVDPLDYAFLDRCGFVDHSWLPFHTHRTVTIRLKRLQRRGGSRSEPGDATTCHNGLPTE